MRNAKAIKQNNKLKNNSLIWIIQEVTFEKMMKWCKWKLIYEMM